LRVTHLEAKKLVERGDRLGAATLQLGAGLRDEALETLKALPPPKAYHFMEKLKLEVEAKAFASEELEKSRAAGNLLHVARWLELLGDKEAAIETYILAERKDKAAGVYETMGQHLRAAELMEHAGHLDRAGDLFRKAGDLANAERVAALPRPAVAPKTDEVVEAKSEGELGVSASASDSAVTP
jgi:tetratricopeptide (TPR) repeat protein